MDKLNLPESRQFAYLSEVVLGPGTSHDDTVAESKIIDIALNDVKEEPQKESTSDSSLDFKNLLFELPIFKHNFSTKRKQEFLLTEQSEEKRKKLEENADLDNENSDDDDVEKVFNYLTGTYEPIAKCVKSEPDETPKNQPETISVQEQKSVRKNEAIGTGHVQGFSTDIVLSKSDAATAPHIGFQASLSNNISFSIDDPNTFLDNSPSISSVVSLDTHIESQQPCHDDNSNNSLIIDDSPSERSAQIDQSAYVTITASKNNSILKNNNSLADDPLPKSSNAVSPKENRHPRTDASLNNTIFFNAEEQNISLGTSRSVPQEVPSPESNLLCHDDNSNHSVLSINSPVDLSDDSSNDVIITPENNLSLETSTSSSVVKSSGVILKELYISITPLPISNDYLSLSNGNSDRACSNVDNVNYVNLTKSDTKKAEKYCVKNLGLTLALSHWNCKTCGFKAKAKNTLISHIYNAHLKDDYEMKIRCKVCDFECNTPREMEQHELSHAISVSDDNLTLSTIASENSIRTGKSSFRNRIVSDCSDSSPTKYIKTRTNEETIVIENTENEILELSDSDGDFRSKPMSIYRQCFLCKFATNRDSNLKDHAEIHKGKMYYCEDHFWSSAVSTCGKCTFENIMTNLNRSCQQSIMNKKQKLQNTDRNENAPVENASSEMPLLSVEAAPYTETSLENVSLKNPNVSHTMSNEHEDSSTPNTGNGCNLEHSDAMTQNTEKFNSKTIQDLDHEVRSSDTLKEPEIPPTLEVSVPNYINYEEQEEDILGENYSNAVKNTEKSNSSTKVIEPSGPASEKCIANVDVEMPVLSVEAAPDTETSLGNVSPKSPNVSHTISNEHEDSSTPNIENGCNLNNYDGMTQNTENFKSNTVQDLDHQVSGSKTSKVSDISLTQKVSIENSINIQEQEGILGKDYSSVVQNTEKSSCSTKVIEPIGPTLKSCVANVDVEMPLLSVEAAPDTGTSLGNVLPKIPNVSRTISNEHEDSFTPNTGNGCNLDNSDGLTQNTEQLRSKTIPDLDNEVRSSDTSKESEIPPTLKVSVTNSINKEQEEDIQGQNYFNVVQNTEKSNSSTKVIEPNDPALESCVANVDVEMPLLSVEAASDTGTSLGIVLPKSPNVSHTISNEHEDSSTPNTEKGCNLDNSDGMTQNTEKFNSKTVQDLDHQVSCSNTSKVSDIPLTQEVSIENSINNQEQEEGLLGESYSNVVQKTEKPSSITKLIEINDPTLETGVATVAGVIEPFENSVSIDCRKRKSSENLERDTIRLDGSAGDGFAITFKCFDCDTLICKKDELKTHALSCHPNSSFLCNIHESKIDFHECAKCVYELIFRTFQRAQLPIQDPFHVDWNLKRLGEDGQPMTPYKEPKINERHYLNSDSDSDISWDNEPTEIRITRARASQNKGVTKPNQETSQLSDDGDSAGDTDSDSDDSFVEGRPSRTKNNLKRIAKAESKVPSLENKFKRRGVPCFDCCNFFTNRAFVIHIGRHIGSKFQCIRHQNFKSSSCQKCYYESALQAVIKRMKYCKCGYSTADAYYLKRHQSLESKCAQWKKRALPSGEMRCLVCSYRTRHKIFLKYHMVDHLALTLCCTEHKGSYRNCELCLNEECLETAKKEVIICERCNFKTLVKQIFDGHVCKGETVENSNNNTIQKGKDRSTTNAKERTITDNQKTNCQISETHPLEATGSENVSISTTQNNLTKNKGAKCFDCNAYFPDRSVRFSSHICYHIGSKYQCIKHQKVKPDDCQGCYYETALKDVLKIVKSCDDCGYKTLFNSSLNKHKNSSKGCKMWTNRPLIPREMRCLTCQYVTKHKKFLKYHMVDHLDLTLSCNKKHDANDGSCELCLNEKCLESAKKEVITCEKCNFQTLVKQVLDAHICTEKSVQKAQESTEKVCDSQDNTKDTTITSSKTTDSRRDRENDSTVAPTPIKAKCFDCKYSSEENDSTFKEHVCRHIGSKYQCIEHWKNKDANCLKCLYEEILQELQTEVNTCNTCGYKTLNKLKFTTHRDDTESCRKWANRKSKSKRIRCLKCQYDTTHRKFLQYHMVDHLDVIFSCDVHPESKDAKCIKCIYEECLKNAKKEVKTCDKCNFKTAIKHIFNLHNCEEDNSKETAQNTFQSITAVGNNEGDETMIQTLGKNDKSSKETENTNDIEVNHLLDGDNAQSGKEIGNKTEFSIENITDKSAILKNKGNTQSLETTLAENMGSSTTTETVESDKGDITQRAQCFDCQFTCTDKVNRFFDHICRHIGSKYQCIEHQIKPNKDCQKCHYESALKAVRDKVQFCNRCGYKTTNNSKYSRHIKRIKSCDKWRNRSLREREMRCLQCQYVTTHKKFLKYHMVDHLNLTLSCDLHREKEDDTCATCLNVKSLENAKKEVKICEKCNFKTLIKQIFNCHDCKEDKSTTIQYVLVDRKAEDNNCKRIEDTPKEVTGGSLTGINNNSKNSDNTEFNCDVSQSVNENGIIIKSEIRQCFDCKFSSDEKNAFEEHVCRHIGSKYQCVEHWRSNGKNCPKCQYEEVLQKLKIKIKACNICGYKTLDKLGMTRHLEKFGSCSSWVNHLEPDEIRCLQCQYVTKHKKFLKYHMVDHLDVTFSCDVHQDDKNANCEKCIYEECLVNAKSEVQTCNKCDLKTVIEPIFDIHNCEGNITTEQQGVSSIEETINLVEKNDASSKDTDTINKSNNTQETSIVKVQINTDVKCFDCKYSCKDRLFTFRKHIVRHVGSKFECMDHTELKYMDCLKCYYEVMLSKVAQEMKHCPKCDYTTIDTSKLNSHINGIDCCRKWVERKLKPGQIRCFECPYMTTHKKFLKYHMVEHLDTKFDCKKHRGNKNNECLKCIYAESLQGAKKEAIICGKCKFKTVIKKVFKIHECKKGNVEGETENNAKRYTCLDCNEFTSHKKDELETHAIVHYESEFQCDEHSREQALDNCSKCFYQNIIESVKKSVIVCEFCPFKACSDDVFGAHVCVNKNDDDDLTGAKNEERDSKSQMFICYHCEYQSNYHAGLKSHAVRHYGQTYKCDDHHTVRGFNCRKCTYEHILKAYDTCLKVCEKCNFKTLNNFDFDSHVNRNACSAVPAKVSTTVDNAAISFNCFDCKVVCQKEHGLKRHAVRHIGSTFKCNEHHGATDHYCRKCIYEDIVQNIESETFTCSNCEFKAYTWLHLKSHQNNKVNCQLFRTKQKAEGKQISPILIYKCFDCDFSHQRKEFLVKHVAVHGNSTFQCSEHRAHVEDCAQCLYRDLLNKSLHWVQCFDCKPPVVFTTRFSLKRHILRSHIDSSYVCKKHDPKSEKCPQCQYECLVTQTIMQHKLACYDCKDKYFRTKELLKMHITECHLRSEFVCKVHSLQKNSESCDMCAYEELVPICESEAASDQSVAGSSKEVNKDYQCFDCKFKTYVRSGLIRHITNKHADSGFSCSQHTMGNIEEETCAMCRYETALVSAKQQLLNCSKCEFQAVSTEALDKHCKQNHSEAARIKDAVASDTVVIDDTAILENLRGQNPTKFRCFHCGYFVTDSERNLLKHLRLSSHAKYGKIEFKCKKHRMYDDACERCVFARISKKAGKQ